MFDGQHMERGRKMSRHLNRPPAVRGPRDGLKHRRAVDSVLRCDREGFPTGEGVGERLDFRPFGIGQWKHRVDLAA